MTLKITVVDTHFTIKENKLSYYFKDKIIFKKPTIFSKPIAKIERRLLIIQSCDVDWCKIKTSNFKGWIDKKNLWGVN